VLSHNVVGISRHAPAASDGGRHVRCDLTDRSATARLVQDIKPEVVIHTQACADVDRCEVAPDEAEALNVHTVEHLCQACVHDHPLLLAISSDYVFDGAKEPPYTEADEPRPMSVYGKTKLAGERIALAYPRAVVVRVSTLFGPGRQDFCDTIVQRLTRGERVEAFADQTTSPTYTQDAAEGLRLLMEALARQGIERQPRLYHLTNAGWCTRVEFARTVAAIVGGDATLIRPIFMRDQRRPAPRPACSALASRQLSGVIGRELRPWQEAVRAYLADQGWQN